MSDLDTQAPASKYLGISKTIGGTWRARVMVRGLRISLGCYPNELEAAHVAFVKRAELHGEFAGGPVPPFECLGEKCACKRPVKIDLPPAPARAAGPSHAKQNTKITININNIPSSGRWRVRLNKNGVRISCGCYPTEQQAREAAEKKRAELAQ